MEDEVLTGTFDFTDVGRSKATFTAILRGEDSFFKIVKQHLMSRDISYMFDTENGEGDIFAGMRPVGKFKKRH